MRLRFGPYTFDDRSRELRRDGVLIPLSPKAFHLLEVLIEARPHPVAREALYQQLWPDVIVEPGNLHGLISEIRIATGERELIRTAHRVGYAFAAEGVVEESVRFSIILGGEEIPLRSGVNGIGRDPHDAIVIHAPEVSRHHARIIVAGTTVMLEDLGSKNGTYIGTQRVTTSAPVQSGDEILVGTIRMRLVQVDPLASTV